MAPAGKIVPYDVQHAQPLQRDAARFRRLQQVVPLQPQRPDVVHGGDVQLVDGVDFVVQDVERVDVVQTVERVGTDDAQVGLLQREQLHVRETPEGERAYLGQVHEGELQVADLREKERISEICFIYLKKL